MVVNMSRFVLTLLISILFIGCESQPRNFKPAGFDSWSEARPYLLYYLYYANKIAANEWDDFYKRFPEYHRMGAPYFHPPYVAYAFRWNTLRKKSDWPRDVTYRLDSHDVIKGDDIFQVTYALGAPDRVIFDNDFEVIMYKSGKVFSLSNGKVESIFFCENCHAKRDEKLDSGMSDLSVITTLGLSRPQYSI